MFTKKSPVSRLRAAVSAAFHADLLHDLPDQFAGLITAFEAINVHPEFRADVMRILNSSVNLGRSVLDHTYPAQEALAHVMDLMQLLPRMIHHLTNRPTASGYAIMMPGSKEIFPQVFTTEAEANGQLQRLQALGASRSAIVTPVQIISDHVVQPAEAMPPLVTRQQVATPSPVAPQPATFVDPLILRDHVDRLDREVQALVQPPSVEDRIIQQIAEATRPPAANAPNLPAGGDSVPPAVPPGPSSESPSTGPAGPAPANP